MNRLHGNCSTQAHGTVMLLRPSMNMAASRATTCCLQGATNLRHMPAASCRYVRAGRIDAHTSPTALCLYGETTRTLAREAELQTNSRQRLSACSCRKHVCAAVMRVMRLVYLLVSCLLRARSNPENARSDLDALEKFAVGTPWSGRPWCASLSPAMVQSALGRCNANRHAG